MTKESVIIDSSDPSLGEAHVELAAKYEGEPIQIRFDPDFLLDGVKAVEEETIRLEMKDSVRAALMRAGQDYLYLIMPIVVE